MAVNIFDWSDKRAMLESLAPKFPEYAKELAAVEADLTVAADKLYEIIMRSIDEEGSGDEKY